MESLCSLSASKCQPAKRAGDDGRKRVREIKIKKRERKRLTEREHRKREKERRGEDRERDVREYFSLPFRFVGQ